MQRRRFLFWIGLGVFQLGEKLQASGLDELAAAIMRDAESEAPVHWRADSNAAWQWYIRETLVDNRWTISGITTPIHKETREPYLDKPGYLDASLVPVEFRVWDEVAGEDVEPPGGKPGQHLASPTRRARHGRPPSKWLRSLNADELRIWLKTIDVPEALVSGMSFWTHLTRDHFFDDTKIAGLTVDEQGKLHGAAHHGY